MWRVYLSIKTWLAEGVHLQSLTARPEKKKNDGWKTSLSFWTGNFSGAMFNFGGSKLGSKYICPIERLGLGERNFITTKLLASSGEGLLGGWAPT